MIKKAFSYPPNPHHPPLKYLLATNSQQSQAWRRWRPSTHQLITCSMRRERKVPSLPTARRECERVNETSGGGGETVIGSVTTCVAMSWTQPVTSCSFFSHGPSIPVRWEEKENY